ncbi:MAG: YncE family protein [Methanosarcina sp.]
MRTVVASFLALCGLCWSLPLQANAAVYWGRGTSIAGANLDGGNFDPEYIGDFPGSEIGDACGVAVDAEHIYWADAAWGRIGRANLDGTDPEFSFIAGAEEPCGVALDGRHIFWANTGADAIGRANLDGSGVSQRFRTGMQRPCGVAVRGSLLYWASPLESSIGLAEASGEGPIERNWIEGASRACGIAVDEGHVYWGSFGTTIGRADWDGNQVEPAFISGLEQPCGIAIDASHLYWTERAGGNGWLGRSGLDGSDLIAHLAPNAGGCGPAVDSQPFPLDRSSHLPLSEFSVARIRHNRNPRDPVTFLAVDVPSAGDYDLDTPKGVDWNLVGDSGEEGHFKSAGRKWFAIWLMDTRFGKRLGRTIRHRGRVGIALTIRYIAPDHNEAAQSRRVFLVRGGRPLKSTARARRRAVEAKTSDASSNSRPREKSESWNE